MKFVISFLRHQMVGWLFLAGLLAASPFARAQPQNSAYPLRDAVECMPRGGLPNFFAKLHRGGEVKIGYLGGSITEQAGWRVKSRLWFQKQFPQAKVTEINAGMGGTGSDLGVFRMDADVLAHQPDLLLVEFAVNDADASPDVIRKAMEGIVRKTWKTLGDCDICFIYTVTERDIAGVKSGKMKRSESVMEEVADFYGIPSIHLGLEVARLEEEGKLIMASPEAHVEQVSGDTLNVEAGREKGRRIVFSKDGVHPYLDTGHLLYMNVIARSMDSIEPIGKPAGHKLAPPLAWDNWEKARMVSLDSGVLAGDVRRLDIDNSELARKFVARIPALWEMKPGATLAFKFKGTKVGIYDLMGPDCGSLEVTLDGNPKKLLRFDGYSTYHRISALKVGDNLPDTEHEVTIKVLPDVLDKGGIILEARRKDFIENREKYNGSNWYGGAILLVGEILKSSVRW